jgi:hypothetical protein
MAGDQAAASSSLLLNLEAVFTLAMAVLLLLRHTHRHEHDDLDGVTADQPFWLAHEHRYGELEHAHHHLSDALCTTSLRRS